MATTTCNQARKVAIVTNQITDFRYPVFRELLDAGDLQLRIFLSSPLTRSCASARAQLPLTVSKTLSFWFTIQHREVGTTQREQLGIPLGLLWDLLRYRPDVIVTGDYGLRSLLCLGVARILRIPVVLWSEETSCSARGRTPLQHGLRRFLSRHVDAFLAWGAPAADYVRSLGVEPRRLFRCSQAVDNDFWMSRSSSLNKQRERGMLGFQGTVFLLVAQLIPRKGIVNYLQALSAMPADVRATTRTVIVGEGEQATMLRELVAAHGLDVTFAGRVSPADLVRYYVAADAFVFPSLEDVWGMVVNEALCCGLPVLGSKFAGASQELVAERGVGNVFDPTDIEALSRQLAEWALHPPEISAQACRAVVAPLNAKQSADAIKGMLRDVLGVAAPLAKVLSG